MCGSVIPPALIQGDQESARYIDVNCVARDNLKIRLRLSGCINHSLPGANLYFDYISVAAFAGSMMRRSTFRHVALRQTSNHHLRLWYGQRMVLQLEVKAG